MTLPYHFKRRIQDIQHNQAALDNELEVFCGFDDIDVIKFLLFSPELSYHAILSPTSSCLSTACKKGHLNVVQYLLTDPNVCFNVNIHAHSEQALLLAAKEGHVHIVEYLLTSTEIKEHASILNSSELLIQSDINVAKFLLFNYGLKVEAKLEEKISAKSNPHLFHLIQLFQLYTKIDTHLATSNIELVRTKI